MPSVERQSSDHQAQLVEAGPPSRRLAAVSASLAQLEQAVGEIHQSEGFRRYLEAQAKFHRYSCGNVLLILGQRPEATQVAGFRAWHALGRHVRRGEQGIRILVPLRGRAPARAAADDVDAEGQVQRRLFFGTGVVFDIAQTEGDPLPTHQVPVLAGAGGQELAERLQAIAEQEHLRVERGSERFSHP
jgi:antirestriction protein ArdC